MTYQPGPWEDCGMKTIPLAQKSVVEAVLARVSDRLPEVSATLDDIEKLDDRIDSSSLSLLARISALERRVFELERPIKAQQESRFGRRKW